MKSKKLNNKKAPLKCHFCSNPPTYAVMLELRDRLGPPIKENNVIRLVCDIHSVETDFDYWVPKPAFHAAFNTWKRIGVTLKKEYCNITFVKLKK